jgi:hypothetical protein
MLFEQIRRDARVEGLSVRALAKRHRVHRRTVRQALASAVPPEPPAAVAGAQDRSVRGRDRCDAAVGSDGPKETAAYRGAGVGPVGR